MKVKVRKPERDKAFGTIALVESVNGQLDLHCDIVETAGVQQSTLDRIRQAIAGLAYIYEREHEVIDKIGAAYLNGMEEGIKFSAHMTTPPKKPKGNGASMGFRADVK